MSVWFVKNQLDSSLESILNARSGLPLSAYLAPGSLLSTLNFGLPDFSTLSMTSEDDRRFLCRIIEHALEAFEPRLSHVKVDFNNYDPNTREANLVLQGVFQQDDVSVNILLKVLLWEFAVRE